MAEERLTSAAVYPRVVGAGLARIWENVLDWEHLPWLHREAFSSIELLGAGREGWRARVGIARSGSHAVVDVSLDRPRRRYLTRTIEGVGAGTCIWTTLEPIDEATTRIEVEFLVPDAGADELESIGAGYVALYRRLWDQDEAMMRRRQWMLYRSHSARRGDGKDGSRVSLGPRHLLESKLPLQVDLGQLEARVVNLDGEIVAHSTVCPHRLGPLESSTIEDGCIRCPWHGYRFDVRTGQSVDGHDLVLDRVRAGVDPGTNEVWLAAD